MDTRYVIDHDLLVYPAEGVGVCMATFVEEQGHTTSCSSRFFKTNKELVRERSKFANDGSWKELAKL